MFELLEKARHGARHDDDLFAPGLAGHAPAGPDILVAHDGALAVEPPKVAPAGDQKSEGGTAGAAEMAALAALQPALGAPVGEETAPHEGPSVASQQSTTEEMNYETFLTLKDVQHAEKVNFGGDKVNFVGRTRSVQVGAGQALNVLADDMDERYFHRAMAQQPVHLVVLDAADKEVVTIVAANAELPRRYQITDLAPGAYTIEIRGKVDQSQPPALVQVRIWADAATELRDDAALAANTEITACGDIFSGAPPRYSERVTLGKIAGMGVNVPVAVGEGQDFVARVHLYPQGPYKAHYLGFLQRAPETTNANVVLRVVDGKGAAVAHVTRATVGELPCEIVVKQLAPGEYRLVMVQEGNHNNRGAPLQGIAFARTGEADGGGAAPAPSVS